MHDCRFMSTCVYKILGFGFIISVFLFLFWWQESPQNGGMCEERKFGQGVQTKQDKPSQSSFYFCHCIAPFLTQVAMCFFFFFSFVAKSINFIKKQKQTCNLSTKPQNT
jgi:hypothetical protein